MSYWDRPKPVRRLRAVTLEQLTQHSAALLDDGGLPALTIRALAARLDVAPPSLYSRIESVDDLLDLALDHVLDRDDRVWSTSSEDPRDLLLDLYDHLLRHPWAPLVIGRRPPRGPAYIRYSERLLEILLEQGIPDPLTVAYAMTNFVIGSVTTASSAAQEPHVLVDPERAPTYAALHSSHEADPRAIVEAGLGALCGLSIARTP